MQRPRYLLAVLLAAFVCPFVIAASPTAADWPMWRHDAQRTAASPAELPAQLSLQWQREMGSPQPAFPYDARLCFDRSYEPVVSGKTMFVPSMVTDSVTALNVETGAVRWKFFAGGPVRFAPAAWGGRLYIVADDGYLYCLRAADGSLFWKVSGAPPQWGEEKLLGHERMVSRWPALGGPVLADGRVYFAAGFWTNEGVYVCGVDARTGKLLWRSSHGSLARYGLNDHGGHRYGGLCPQGYLAMIDGKLMVPCGRALPAVFDPRTGMMEPYTSGWGGRYGLAKGSWWVCGIANYFFHSGDLFGAQPGAAQIPAPRFQGPFSPAEFAKLADLPLATVKQWIKEKKVKTVQRNGQVLVSPFKPANTTYLAWWTSNPPLGEQLALRDRPRLQIDPMNRKEVGVFRTPILTPRAVYYSKLKGYASLPEQARYAELVAYDITRPRWGLSVTEFYGAAPLIAWWTLRFDKLWSMRTSLKAFIKAGRRLYCGGKDMVAAVDIPKPGEQPRISWTAGIAGTPTTMLAAAGRLFVVTKAGAIYCFGPKSVRPRSYTDKVPDARPVAGAWTKLAAGMTALAPVKNGYCLVLGLGTGRLVHALIQTSELQVIVLERDWAKVHRARRLFDAEGLYGVRVHVLHGALGSLGLPPYFASLVVAEPSGTPWLSSHSMKEFIARLYRCLRPYGGVACLPLSNAAHRRFARGVEADNLPGSRVKREGSLTLLRRAGALQGGDDWTHVTGGPGNTYSSRDRALKPPLGLLWFGGSLHRLLRWRENFTCVVAAGRMFLTLPGELHAVDVYTGRQLWSRNTRMNSNTIVALPDAVYAVDGDVVLRLDPRTGETVSQFAFPAKLAGASPETWADQLRVWHDYLINSTSAQRVVCLDRNTGRLVWSRKCRRDGLQLVAGGGRVYCVEYWLPRHRRRGEANAGMLNVLALEAHTGEQLWQRSLVLPEDTVDKGIIKQKPWLGALNPVLQYSEESDTVVLTAVRSTLSAYRGSDGTILWRRIIPIKENLMAFSFGRAPILIPNLLIPQSGALFDLQTGVRRTTRLWEGSTNAGTRGCGRAIASKRLVTVRDADASFFSLSTGCETSFRGVRAGCSFNLIPADGVLLAPYKSFHCSCNYGIRTSFAATHLPTAAPWLAAASQGAAKRLRLAVHPGDKALQFRVTVTNRSPATIRDEIQFELPAGWSVEPGRKKIVLPGHGSGAYVFKLALPASENEGVKSIPLHTTSGALSLEPSLIRVRVSKPVEPLGLELKTELNSAAEMHVVLQIANQSDRTYSGTADILDPASWKRLPREFRFDSLSPGAKRRFSVNVGRLPMHASRPGNKIEVVVRAGNLTLRRTVQPPLIAPKVSTAPPLIDGRLDDPCWQHAAKATGFVTQGTDAIAEVQSVLYVMYDDANLFFALRCCDRKTAELKAAVTQHDGQVWTDDSVELFLDTNWDRKTYYQFIANARGVGYEGLDLDSGKWNCDWTVKTSVDRKGWTAELAVPFVSLGIPAPKPGAIWGVNVVRNLRGKQTTQLFSTYGSNHKPAQFGQLVFSD